MESAGKDTAATSETAVNQHDSSVKSAGKDTRGTDESTVNPHDSSVESDGKDKAATDESAVNQLDSSVESASEDAARSTIETGIVWSALRGGRDTNDAGCHLKDTALPESFCSGLLSNWEHITDGVVDIDDVAEYLVSRDALTAAQRDAVQRSGGCVSEMLRRVHGRGEQACRAVFVALKCTEQMHIVQLPAGLERELADTASVNVLAIDMYMKDLKTSYREDVEERNRVEAILYGNVINLEQHQPVIIHHGHRQPDGQTRRGFNEFVIEQTDKQRLTLSQVFSGMNGRASPRSILMLGGPGMGKTSLCFTILNHFSSGQWRHHRFVFFISLKTTGAMPEELSLVDLLFNFTRIAVDECQKEKLMSQLQKRQHDILIVLDGYDECDEFMKETLITSTPYVVAKRSSILRNLVGKNLLPKAQILITSRPFREVNLALGVDRVVEIAGLSQEAVAKLLTDLEVTKEIDTFLEANLDVASLLSIPVNLQAFISYLEWLKRTNQDIANKLPKTKFALYAKQMLPVLSYCLRDEDVRFLEDSEMWRHSKVKELLLKLALLAGTSVAKLGEKQILFTSEELAECQLKEVEVKAGGLMSSFSKQIQKRFGVGLLVYFYFTHLTNLEWCAGLNTVKNEQRYIQDIIDQNHGQLDVILTFAVGFLGDGEGQEIVEGLHGMSPGQCQNEANHMLAAIVKSERCRATGGHLFALEAFFEGQFVDPCPLLKLLAPDGRVLQIADIALHNRQSVRYFIASLNASVNGESETGRQAALVDSVMVHFADHTGTTVQNNMLAEVCKMEGIQCLQIENSGICKAVFGKPLQLLLMYGRMKARHAARVIHQSHAKIMCLYLRDGPCHLPSRLCVGLGVEEIYLYRYNLHPDTVNNLTQGSTNLRAITQLLYDRRHAYAVCRLVAENGRLHTLGLELNTLEEDVCDGLSRVLTSSISIRCLTLQLWPAARKHIDILHSVITKMSSLRELWLSFLPSSPDDVVASIAKLVCQHPALETVALMDYDGAVHIASFLPYVCHPSCRLRRVYHTDNSSVQDTVGYEEHQVRVMKIKRGFDTWFMAPLIYSGFMLRQIPEHTKKFIAKRFVE